MDLRKFAKVQVTGSGDVILDPEHYVDLLKRSYKGWKSKVRAGALGAFGAGAGGILATALLRHPKARIPLALAGGGLGGVGGYALGRLAQRKFVKNREADLKQLTEEARKYEKK